ncbi:MAG: hypothetical protein M3092_05870 [Actinomycetia bacterium]|nr:hypothetical protein [Actinomycetes bacterium]
MKHFSRTAKSMIVWATVSRFATARGQYLGERAVADMLRKTICTRRS